MYEEETEAEYTTQPTYDYDIWDILGGSGAESSTQTKREAADLENLYLVQENSSLVVPKVCIKFSI